MAKKKRQPWNPLLCSYPDSDKVNNLSFEAETLYTRLIAACDDNSNYDGKPILIMCGVLKKRFDASLVDATKTKRLRDELVTQNLVRLYTVNGNEYLHILSCKKHLRKDINPDIRFPEHPQEFDTQGDTESVPITDTTSSRPRSEKSPSNTNTDTNTDTNTIIRQKLASLLLQKIRERKPDFRKPNLKQWAKHIDAMIRIDKRKPETIEKVIIWCQADDFWQNNILSVEKLRKQFDRLELQKNARNNCRKTGLQQSTKPGLR